MRFSALDGINSGNVQRLQEAFSFHMDGISSFAGAPQTDGHILFVLAPFPHALYAFDLDAPAPSLKWRFAPSRPDGAAEGLAFEGPINFGPKLAGGTVYFNTLDGHTIAVDAESGHPAWDVRTAEPRAGETLVSAPLVLQDRVVIGNAGDDFGARGWIAALDRATGALLWKRYSTGPDADVGIGGAFKPYYATDRGRDLGTRSWPPSAWQHGGGSVAGSLSYDPATDIVFHGTGHPAPWDPEQRPGDNKWTSGIFARAAADGTARWFDQISPHDPYSLGGTAANVLIDRDWHGTPRRLLVHADANGFVYVLDRLTGEILSATAFGHVNAIKGIDRPSGAISRNEEKLVGDGMTRDICPGWPGATAPGAFAAYSPQTALLYIPASFLCMDEEARATGYIKGTAFVGASLRIKPAGGQSRGALVAWDLAEGKAAWTIPEDFPLGGASLATAGDLVFYGTLDGWFKAADAKTGHVLWQFRAASGIIGQPISYSGADGRQYIAVVAGLGGPLGMIAGNEIDPRDATAAHGMANALPDLPHPAEPGGTLYIFRLP
jgi:PQQ-dependent dehydrogenase (methanol/ethanol family)